MTHVLASLDGPDSWDMCHLSGQIHFLYQRFPGAVKCDMSLESSAQALLISTRKK